MLLRVKRQTRRIWYVLLFMSVLPNTSVSAQSDLTSQEWRDDLEYLIHEIERRHADAFHKVTREEFEATADRLSRRIPNLDDHEVIVGMARLLSLIGDAHTWIRFPTEGPLAFHSYPIRLVRLQDGTFIERANSAHADVVGAEVVGIGELSIEEVWDRVEPVVQRDNPMTLRFIVPLRIVIPEFLHAVGVLSGTGAADFVIEQEGVRDTVRLVPDGFPVSLASDTPDGADSTASLYWQDPDDPYWWQHVPEHQAVYFQFNLVREDPDDPFRAFVRRLEERLEDPDVERLVIDLRRNNGGGWRLTIPLIKMLIRAGFEERGELVVITGPATLSAAVVFATELDNWLDPVFVGLPTGASPNQFGEIVFFELPNSGIHVGYAAAFFQTAGYESTAPWIAPDVAVEMTSADYFARYDPVLSEALTYQPEEPIGESLNRILEAEGLDAALAEYERYRSDPRHAYHDTEKALRSLGNRLVEEERHPEALRVHRHNVEVHPDRSRAYFGLGDALTAAGRDEEAHRAFEQALRRLPEDPSLYPALRIVIEDLLGERLE